MALPTPANAASNLLITVMLLAWMQVACAFGTGKLPGTYSSLTYNVEGGDLIGYEVRIIPTNQGMKAVVQVAEGDAGRIYIVDVVEKAGVVSFEVPLASGMYGKFNGMVSSSGLAGTIIYPSSERESVLLKRCASYWER